MRSAVVLLLLAVAGPLSACSVCGGSWRSKTTLREWFHQSKAAVAGTLKNPKANPSGTGGTTEFHFGTVLKSAAVIDRTSSVIVPQYFPVIGDTSPDYLFFFDDANGRPAVTNGVPATPAVVEYLSAAAKLDAKDSVAQLTFFFKHLDSPDATVSADAFTEFAKAPDADIVKAKAEFDAAKLARMLADPKTPDDRLGVYAALLGVCGGAKHVGTFTDLLKEPLSERVSGNLAGVLTGYVLLDPKGGWAEIRRRMTDDTAPFDRRLAPLSAVRFLQAAHPTEWKPDVLAVYGELVASPDFADLVIDDLRRWGWWDHTAEVFAAWGKTAGEVREVRKAIVRYALSCPKAEAKTFLESARKSDAKLVAQVEASEKLKR